MTSNKQYADYIKRLTKRRDYLGIRISRSTDNLSYDKAEYGVLDWVIAYMEDKPAEAIDHINTWLTIKGLK